MSIKTFLCVFILVMAAGMGQSKPQFGRALLFNENWRFSLSDVKEGAAPEFNDSKWRLLDLPHDWSVEGAYSPDKASATGYLPGGIAWYRKTFTVPASEKGKNVFAYFEGIYNHGEIFINGHSVGNRPNGYISFMVDLTPHLKYGEENLIAVRVDHSLDADSRWYTGSGIYRDVYLVYSSPVHIDLWGVYFKTDNISAQKADISVETTLNNSTATTANVKVSHEIIDLSSGKVVSKGSSTINVGGMQKQKSVQVLTLSSPRRWSLERPNLYTVRTKVEKGGIIIDQNEQKMGIRTLQFDPNKGFALNGNWTKIKGVCIHHDAGCLGSAVPREVWRRRLNTLKEMGANAIRMTHNPQAPDVYELCDDLGLLVMDEAFDEWEYAKKKWIKGWNKGVPGYQGAASFFTEWSDKDLRDMILRDRNHASVIMWSIGNEVDYPNDPYTHPVLDHANINQPVQGGYLPDHPKAERLGGIAKRLAAMVRSLDTTRPVTAGLAGVVMSNETEYPGALDITGYNYSENRYAQDHAQYPGRVIFGSENGHSIDAWKAVRDNEYIFGQFIWTGIDYLGESGAWPSRGFYSGFLDLGGFMKPRGHFRQALWSSKPVTYIGTYKKPIQNNRLSMDAWPVWNYTEGEIIRVVCYTNATRSKLMLNGKQAGEVKNQDDNTGILYWDIPYQAGKLEVIGTDKDGNETCNYVLQSSGRPYAITVHPDITTIRKDRGIAHLVVLVVDDKGIPVTNSDDEITCTIDGPATLLGLEASNNTDMGNYTDNIQRVYHGRLLAYLQSAGKTGKVTVTFSAPWLRETSVNLDVTE